MSADEKEAMVYIIRIEAPRFVAACVVNGQRVTDAAPILAWTVGKRPQDVISWAMRRGYRYDAVAA